MPRTHPTPVRVNSRDEASGVVDLLRFVRCNGYKVNEEDVPL